MFIRKRQMSGKRNQLHFRLSMWLFWILAAVLLLQFIGGLLDFCSFAITPSEEIRLIDLGDGVKIQALFGYFRLSADSLPDPYMDVSGKMLGLSISGFALIFEKIPQILILWRCIRVWRKISHFHSPFHAENGRQIKGIGWIILYLGLLQKLLFQLGVSLVSYHKFYFQNPFNLTLLFVGAVVLVIGDVYEYGCGLQKESDELL